MGVDRGGGEVDLQARPDGLELPRGVGQTDRAGPSLRVVRLDRDVHLLAHQEQSECPIDPTRARARTAHTTSAQARAPAVAGDRGEVGTRLSRGVSPARLKLRVTVAARTCERPKLACMMVSLQYAAGRIPSSSKKKSSAGEVEAWLTFTCSTVGPTTHEPQLSRADAQIPHGPPPPKHTLAGRVQVTAGGLCVCSPTHAARHHPCC